MATVTRSGMNTATRSMMTIATRSMMTIATRSTMATPTRALLIHPSHHSGCHAADKMLIGLGRKSRPLIIPSCMNSSYIVATKKLTKSVVPESSSWDWSDGEKPAMHDCHGTHSYNSILCKSIILSKKLKEILGSLQRNNSLATKEQPVVSFLCPNDVSYVISLWGCWLAGCIAVPLCKVHPPAELSYIITNSSSSIVLMTAEYTDKITNAVQETDEVSIYVLDECLAVRPSSIKSPADIGEPFGDHVDGPNGAIIIYTSGTTGRPKGVLHTFDNLTSQIISLVDAWQLSKSDCILHVLPLHHTHGIVNKLMCLLYVGGEIVMLPEFHPEMVWKYLIGHTDSHVNLFMAVPTIYSKLIQYYKDKFTAVHVQDYVRSACAERIRLMVCGSAPLPTPTLNHWKRITSHTLLERYGMTEIGMALSQPLEGARIPGTVGAPLPNVNCRIVSDGLVPGEDTVTHPDMKQDDTMGGELQVKGPSVFKEYWRNPAATKESFTDDGWFKTGDTALCDEGVYQIKGRTSIDIIKSGGYKISALDVETHLLGHPSISECAVVGLPDETWGQKVAAIVVLNQSTSLDIPTLRIWAKDKMAPYTIPTLLKIVNEIPRNVLGKVNKKTLINDIFPVESI